ncbi:MAG: imidazole glycerol phosphate synthase subunit HisH, partial [Deltaproteobacteria bacterium]
SYHIDRAPSDAACAWTRHGKRFVGAVEKGNILACQFHPELSGAWGRELISRWLAC